jgi:hypothetical protein
MPPDHGWIRKTQQAISDTLVSGKLTDWELGFLQSISMKLDKYGARSRISDKQDKALLAILSGVEKLKAKNLPPAHAPSPSRPQKRALIVDFADWDPSEQAPPKRFDLSVPDA